jgi:hypothetical protein
MRPVLTTKRPPAVTKIPKVFIFLKRSLGSGEFSEVGILSAATYFLH